MKIKEIMEQTGLTRRALYYYQEIGLINVKQDETKNNYREFDIETLKRLKQIEIYKDIGLQLKEIKKIFAEKDNDIDIITHQITLLSLEKERIKEQIQKAYSILILGVDDIEKATLDKIANYLINDNNTMILSDEKRTLYGTLLIYYLDKMIEDFDSICKDDGIHEEDINEYLKGENTIDKFCSWYINTFSIIGTKEAVAINFFLFFNNPDSPILRMVEKEFGEKGKIWLDKIWTIFLDYSYNFMKKDFENLCLKFENKDNISQDKIESNTKLLCEKIDKYIDCNIIKEEKKEDKFYAYINMIKYYAHFADELENNTKIKELYDVIKKSIKDYCNANS